MKRKISMRQAEDFRRAVGKHYIAGAGRRVPRSWAAHPTIRAIAASFGLNENTAHGILSYKNYRGSK